MGDTDDQERFQAIHRYQAGEKVRAICSSMDRSKQWFYKWLNRSKSTEAEWYASQSRSPQAVANRTRQEIEAIVKLVRLELYNEGLFCGAQAIAWRMEEQCIKPIPSLRTINRILVRHALTHRRTGRYEPKGKKYPSPRANKPGMVHQTDIVGPCYLRGPVRFYSLHSVDLATRCSGISPMSSMGGQGLIDSIWAIWQRLGMPKSQQVDNAMEFYGSPTHPRGMGPLIRLCLPLGIEPCFIPIKEPWRNGVVEKFNHHWQQKFLRRVDLHSQVELRRASLAFEHKHNSRYRYSALGGKTPLASLTAAGVTLPFPPAEKAPQLPLSKPKHGRYHAIRFIRQDGRLNLFGESFPMPSEVIHEYVKATVDVTHQRLKIYLDTVLIDDLEYRLR